LINIGDNKVIRMIWKIKRDEGMIEGERFRGQRGLFKRLVVLPILTICG